MNTIRLPSVPGGILARSIAAAGRTLTVRGMDYTAFATGRLREVTWRSASGGATWTATRR